MGHIIGFAGRGQGLFIAGVSQAFRAAYSRYAQEEHQQQKSSSSSSGADAAGTGAGLLCLTSYASAVSSLPRLQMAWNCGLETLSTGSSSKTCHKSWGLCRAVLSAGEPGVLAWAREQGMLRSACA